LAPAFAFANSALQLDKFMFIMLIAYCNPISNIRLLYPLPGAHRHSSPQPPSPAPPPPSGDCQALPPKQQCTVL
jgi:hypothetical protein